MPDLDFHVIASRCNNSVLFIKPDRRYEVLVRILNLLLLFPKVQVPYSNRFVVRGRVQILPIRMDRQAADPVVMASKCG